MKIIEIEWLDSVGGSSWESKEEALREGTADAMKHRTVGYLLQEDDDLILLARSRSESGGMVDGTMQIPRVAVLRKRLLK